MRSLVARFPIAAGARFALAGSLAFVCASLPGTAAADEVVPAFHVQTGFTYLRSPGQSYDDYFVIMTPEISYFFGDERTQVGLNYSFTGSVDTYLPNTIANQAGILLAHDLSPSTKLLFGLNAVQSSIGNYLLTKRGYSTPVVAPGAQGVQGAPNLNTQLLTTTATEGIAHELTPHLRLNEALTAAYVRSLDPVVRFDAALAGLTLGIDRAWEFDAVGVELNSQYAHTIVPPIDSTAITIALGPTWDHDYTRNLSSSAGVFGAIAFSPDPGTTPLVTPAGRASLLYFSEGSGVELAYAGGFEPNTFLGIILRSHQVSVRAFTMISNEYGIGVATGAAYLKAKILDLRTHGRQNSEFDAVIHDAEINWAATDYLTLFLRYQFIGQTAGVGVGAGATPPIVRHGAVFGFDIFGGGRPKKPRVQTKFPTRVDGQDKQIPDIKKR